MALTEDIRILQHDALLARIEAGDALVQPPMHVRIEPTEACNFRCGFCWWHGAGRTARVRAAGDLDFTGRRHLDRARLLRLVDELADMGTRAVSFTGAGDPLVFPGIDEVIARIHSRGLALGVTSNLAMKLGDDLVTALARTRWLRWSMNGGTEATYLATNRPRGGEPAAAFAAARANVARIVAARRACERPASFHASFIIFPENEHDVLAAATLARDLGIDGISFRPDTPFERQAEPLAVSPAVAEQLARAVRTLTGPGFTVHHEETRRADVEKLGDPDLVCFYSNHTTYVAATGDVYPCCYTRVAARYAIGNILAQPFADFWRSEARRAAYRRLSFDACPSCPYGRTNQLLGDLYAGRARARDLHQPAAVAVHLTKEPPVIRHVLILVPPLTNPESDGDPDASRPDFETRRLVSPVEPTTVAADLERRGYAVAILDLGIVTSARYAELDRRLAASRADAVVVVQSILTFATAMDWDGKRAFDLVRRRLPSAVTVLTGAQPTNYPGDAVRAGLCDFSLKGEVDFTVGDLLDALSTGAPLDDIPGLARRDPDGVVQVAERYPLVDVATLPVPAYHVLDAEHRARYAEVLERGKIRYPARSTAYRDIMTSRSCVLRCSFCSVAHLRGPQQKYRRKPLELVLAEIESALADGIEEIHFFDDLFAETEAQLVDFADALARKNLRFHWFVGQGMPLWPLTRDALVALKETGMYRIICPFESGNDRVLRQVAGKVRSSVAHHAAVAGWTRELDLEVIGLFVIGMPGETRYEIRDTVQFAQDHPEIDYSVFSIATPMVGTKLMRTVTRAGRLDDPGKINRVIKRTVALYRTEDFREYEMGVIRTFDWDRINFATPARRAKYAQMVGMTLDELEGARQDSRNVFARFFPDYQGPRSFLELVDHPALFPELAPVIPDQLYA